MAKDTSELNRYIEKSVLVKTTTGDQISGVLKSFDSDFSVTLAGDGGPDPDDLLSGDFNIDYVDGERTINGRNILSVEEWDRPFAD